MDYFEHIEEFCDGQLNADMRAAFEKEMTQNVKLQRAVENYPTAKKISEGLLEIDIRETLDNLKDQKAKIQIDPSKPARRFSIRKISVAASIIAVVCLCGWLVKMQMDQKALTDRVMASYYTPPVDDDGTKSLDTAGMTTFELGIYYFDLNRFADSETQFAQALKEPVPVNSASDVNYWLGHAYLKLNDWQKAKEAFSKSTHPKAAENLKLARVILGELEESELK